MQTRAAITLGLIFLVAACADSAHKSSLTAPDIPPSLDLDATPALTELSSTVGVQRAATGGRANGHAEVESPFFQALYEYSFIALPIGPTPPALASAKGQVQATILRTVGAQTVMEKIHADIDCANFIDIPIPIFGRMATMSGPIKTWTRDGEPVPFPPGEEVLFTVQDNGEGRNAARPDRASAVVPVNGTQNCRVLLISMADSEQGNIQVVFPGERGNDQP